MSACPLNIGYVVFVKSTLNICTLIEVHIQFEFESMFTISMKPTAVVNITEAALLPHSPCLLELSKRFNSLTSAWILTRQVRVLQDLSLPYLRIQC